MLRATILYFLITSISLILAACESGGRDKDNSPSRSHSAFTAPLPESVLLALREPEQPMLTLDAVADRAAVPPGIIIGITITDLNLDTGSVAGTFNVPLSPEIHSLELQFYLTYPEIEAPVLVALTAARDFAVGAAARLDFSGVVFDLTLDDDNDSFGNLDELRARADPYSAESVPLRVVSVTPVPDDVAAGVMPKISARFNSAPAPASFADGGFSLTGPDGAVQGAVAVNDMVMVFSPVQALARDATYTVTLAPTVYGENGTMLVQSFIWIFHTVAGALELPAALLPYDGVLEAGTVRGYRITGLAPGAAFIATLGGLSGNIDLAVHADDTFSDANCVATHAGLQAESCGAQVDAGGMLYLQLLGGALESDGAFSLALTPVTGLFTNQQLSGAVGIDSQHFLITGLVPGAPTLVELTGLSGGNADLAVYTDVFNTRSCRSQRGAGRYEGEVQVLMANEGCVATANTQGQLYVEVTGVALDPNDMATEIAFTLSYGAPVTTDAGLSLPVVVADVPRLLDYYLVSGLQPDARYVVDYKPGRVDYDFSPKLYSYRDAGFSTDALSACWDSVSLCTATTNGVGELYLAVDRVLATDAAGYEFNVYPWKAINREQLPYPFVSGNGPEFLVVQGLAKNYVHRGMLRNDDPDAGLTNGLHATVEGVYSADDFASKFCFNNSYDACDSTLDTLQGLPNDAGELYVYITTHSAMVHNHTFTIAPQLGYNSPHPLPFTETVAKGIHDFVVTADVNKLAFILSGMSDNADLRVFYRSLAVSDCDSALMYDVGGKPAVEFCGVHQGSYAAMMPEVFLVRVDASATASGTSFTLDSRSFYPDVSGAVSVMPRGFGAVSPTGTPTSDFDPVFVPERIDPVSTSQRPGIWAGRGYHFYEVYSLHPDAGYTFTLGGTLASAPITLTAYTGAISAGAADCQATTAAPSCAVHADATGTLRVAVMTSPTLITDAPYTLALARAGDAPAVMPLVMDAPGASLSLAGEFLRLYMSNYYKVTGLDPARAYDIAASWYLYFANVDIYVYQDAVFTNYAQGCGYAVHAVSGTETCAGARPNASGELYLRVYNNYIENQSSNTTYTLTVAPSP